VSKLKASGVKKAAKQEYQKAEEEVKEAPKPKKLWRAPAASSAFSQIMKAEMGGALDTGPRKIEKDAYKQMQQPATKSSAFPSMAQEEEVIFGAPQPAAQTQSKHAKRRAKKKAQKQAE
jgi:hypothetical protein